MPLDVQLFREDQGGDPEKVRESQRRRFKDPKVVDLVIEQDNIQRKAISQLNNANKESRQISIAIGNIRKKAVTSVFSLSFVFFVSIYIQSTIILRKKKCEKFLEKILFFLLSYFLFLSSTKNNNNK